MAKVKKRTKQRNPNQKTSKRKNATAVRKTTQPFEQDSKRRIGQYGGTGEPPIMK
jgi:hypothetical protein